MNTVDISKDRLIEIGKKRIASKKGGDKEKEKSFIKRMIRKFGPGKGFLTGATPTKCLVCGKKLNINNRNQVVKYCNKNCRRKRHNKKKGK